MAKTRVGLPPAIAPQGPPSEHTYFMETRACKFFVKGAEQQEQPRSYAVSPEFFFFFFSNWILTATLWQGRGVPVQKPDS